MFRTFRNLLLCLLAFGGVCSARTGAAVPNAEDRRAVLARQKEHYLQSVQALPLLDRHKMSEILQLKVEAGQLAFHTPLEPWPDFEARRLELEGSSSPASAIYAQFIANNPSARQFEFKVEDYPAADKYGQLHFQWRPSATGRGSDLSIENMEQTGHSYVRVFYMQNVGMARLLVFANDATADHNMQSFNYMEKDFASLRQSHPAEVEEWLRPMLHRLQQDAVFAPDDNTAWQVFASDWPVRAPAEQAVRELLPDLNSQESRVRNRAVDRLTALGRDGASAIARLDRGGLSLEQNIKLDSVVARFKKLNPAEARRLGDSPDFLLDCQYCDDPTARRLAAVKLHRFLADASLDTDAPQTERVEAVEKARQALHPPATTQPTEQH